MGQIAEACHRADLSFGLEIEASLVGCTGQMLAEIHRQVNHPGMLLVFDAAKILSQGYSPAEVFQQYLAMKPGLGWLHIKDYRSPAEARREARRSPVDEDALKHFVPADVGQCGHEAILRDFRESCRPSNRKLRRRGIPGVFLELEPHLKGAGQFGGFSGPDGMGVAVRACAACSTTSASTITSAISPTSRRRAGSRTNSQVVCFGSLGGGSIAAKKADSSAASAANG